MEKCIICGQRVKYFDVVEMMDKLEICCHDCTHDLKLDWEELNQDR